MIELLNEISSDNLILICVIMSVIALFLAIAISIEIFNNYRHRTRILKEEVNDDNKINIKEDSNIKYVEEDEELEKTKAKLELAKLKERLEQEEKEKKKLLEINLALANKSDSSNKDVSLVDEKKEVISNEISDNKVVNNIDNKVIDNSLSNSDESVKKTEVCDSESNNKLSFYEELEEENAIISYDELKKSSTFGYTDEEMDKYVDEKDAIISIEELERLYKESNAIKDVELSQFDIKHVEDLPEISSDKKFQSSPFISPVYGIGMNEESIQLEQTANLEKLNEEIRKTNEFLKTLKELRKNLQ